MTRTRSVWYLLYRSNFGYKSTKLVVFNTFNTYNTYIYEILRVGWSICLGWGRNLKIEQTWLLKKGPHYGVLTATTSQRHSNSLRWRGLHSVKKGGRFSAAFASAMFLKWMHDVALDWASLTFPCLSLAVWLRARFLARYPLNGVILAESGLKYPLEHPAVHIAAAGAPVKSPSKLPPANGDLRLGETEADIYIYIYISASLHNGLRVLWKYEAKPAVSDPSVDSSSLSFPRHAQAYVQTMTFNMQWGTEAKYCSRTRSTGWELIARISASLRFAGLEHLEVGKEASVTRGQVARSDHRAYTKLLRSGTLWYNRVMKEKGTLPA